MNGRINNEHNNLCLPVLVLDRENIWKWLDENDTREPRNPGSFEKIFSIPRVIEVRVFWTH